MKFNPMLLIDNLDNLIDKAYNKGWFIWLIAGAIIIFVLTIIVSIK